MTAWIAQRNRVASTRKLLFRLVRTLPQSRDFKCSKASRGSSKESDPVQDRKIPAVLICNPGADRYGSDVMIRHSIDALGDRGAYQVTLTLPTRGYLTDQVDKVCKTVVAKVPVLRKADLNPVGIAGMLGRSFIGLCRAIYVIRNVCPDIIYINTITQPVWFVAAKVMRRPLIVHVHEAERGQSRLVSKLLISPLNLADRIICISESVQHYITDNYPRLHDRIHIVYNGIDTDRYFSSRDIASEAVGIGVIGRLSPRKGQDVVLEALRILKNAGFTPRTQLAGTAFVGYEWYEDQLRQTIHDNLMSSYVTLVGYVDAAVFYRHNSIIVVPSRQEPFGLVAAEAMASGCLTIVSETEGLVEIVTSEDQGLTFPPGDARALAEKLAKVLSMNDHGSQFAHTGRDRIVKEFRLERYRKDIKDTVDALIGRS